MSDDKKQQLNALVKAAYDALAEATAFADEHKLGFSWDVAYGMGGSYEGDPEERNYENEDGWFSSSMSC